jgi:hypothetical protein
MSAFDTLVAQEYRSLPWTKLEGVSSPRYNHALAADTLDLERLARMHDELMETVKPEHASARIEVLDQLAKEFEAWNEQIRELREEAACETAQILQHVSVPLPTKGGAK